MKRFTPRRPHASILAALISVVSLLAGSFAIAGTQDETPPPIPSQELRDRLILAEQEKWLDQEAFEPRIAHDEYDVTHYDISLTPDIPSEILSGTVVVAATAAVDDLSQVALDLYECMSVDEVTVNGSPSFYSHNGGVLTVPLGSIYQPGEEFEIGCTFHGTPSFPGQPLPFRWETQNGVPMVLTYSEPYGAPAWWMCKDDPKDKATYTIHLTVPDDLIAVTNGLLDGVTDNGDGTSTFDWSTGYPMSPYLFSIAVTNFESWSEVYTALDGETTMDVTYWAYPSDLADAQVSWDRNIAMMEFCAGLFGEYPFLDEKYGIAEFQHTGAMEHQTCTSMGYPWINGTHSNDFVVIHELCHSWVGDMITMTEWSHAWCKEGFATYVEALYFEELYGEAYYHNYLNNMNLGGYGNSQLYNINPPLHPAIYYKGAWVLHMLRHVLGDEAFFTAIYAYANDPAYRYGVADTDDMCAAYEAATGVELSWFFDEWVYSPGYPRYEYGWSATQADGGYDVALAISQTHTLGPTFKMPIDVAIDTALGTETFVVWDSLRAQGFTLHVDQEPLALELDPDRWIIRNLGVLDVVDSAREIAITLQPNRPNPFRDETTIDFLLDRAGPVVVAIYDPQGRRVVRLLEAEQPAGRGRIVWNGTDRYGYPVAPGIYYCRLQAGGHEVSRPMLLVR